MFRFIKFLRVVAYPKHFYISKKSLHTNLVFIFTPSTKIFRHPSSAWLDFKKKKNHN